MSGNRVRKKVSHVKVGDFLLLDVEPMDEQPHEVLEPGRRTTHLFPGDPRTYLSFKVRLKGGEVFHTFSMDSGGYVDVYEARAKASKTKK